MAFLASIRRNIYLRKLAEERDGLPPVKRPREPLNLMNAKRITVLFPADDGDNRKAIDRWREGHKRAGRKIRVIGYFKEDGNAANFDFRSLSAKDLAWSGVPIGSLVEEFRTETCELLLRLGPSEHPVLDYLATINPAPLKVGPYVAETETPYQIQFDARHIEPLREQLAAIEHIFSYTNAKATT
ncbi:MAG: hypothetical protein AAFN92_08705 [Bacteroidota bacterium]